MKSLFVTLSLSLFEVIQSLSLSRPPKHLNNRTRNFQQSPTQSLTQVKLHFYRLSFSESAWKGHSDKLLSHSVSLSHLELIQSHSP